MNIQDPLQRFRLPGLAEVVAGPGGLPEIHVTAPAATARISLQGGQLLEWQPAGQAPVLWLSRQARFAAGQAIRGGVPVCWPWFGAHPVDATQPQHGFVRRQPWQLLELTPRDDGVRVVLGLKPDAESRSIWPHDFDLRMEILVGQRLCQQLVMCNTGEERLELTAALHGYFRVGDIERVRVLGLENTDYLDKPAGFARRHQQDEVRIHGEVDRIYLQTPGAVTIVDPALQRRIRLEKTGSEATVVWNPGAEQAAAMADFDDDGYRHMLCVEAAVAGEQTVVLEPGQTHALGQCVEVMAG